MSSETLRCNLCHCAHCINASAMTVIGVFSKIFSCAFIATTFFCCTWIKCKSINHEFPVTQMDHERFFFQNTDPRDLRTS